MSRRPARGERSDLARQVTAGDIGERDVLEHARMLARRAIQTSWSASAEPS